GGAWGAFGALNRGKRSIVLDLKSPPAQQAAWRLLRHMDVLVEGFRPGVLDRLGLGQDRLVGGGAHLGVWAHFGFGARGAGRLRAGHDLGYQARAGLLGLGGRDGEPAMPGGQVADIGGAWVAVAGILAALLERASTGRGRVVDVALAEAATSFLQLDL